MGGIDVVIHQACRIKEGRSVLWLMHVLQPGYEPPAAVVAADRSAAAAAALATEGDAGAARAYPAAWVRECKVCVAAPSGQTLGCAAHVAWPLTGALEHVFWVTARRALAYELPVEYGEWAARFAHAALARTETPWVDAARRSGLLSDPEPRGPVARWPWQRQSEPHSGQLLEHWLGVPHLYGDHLWQHAGFTRALVVMGETLAESARDLAQLEALAHALEPWRRVANLLWLAAREGREVHLHPGRNVA